MKNVIVISPHPDDEVLGAGGTLLKHKEKNDNIFWVIVTCMPEMQERKNEIECVKKELGIKKVYELNHPTASLNSDSLITLISQFSGIFNECKPEVLYLPNRSDIHSDHRVVFDAAISCTKSFRYPFIEKILMYECISETEFAPALPENIFLPNYLVDISNYLDKKLDIIKIYKSEIAEHPFPRSLKNIEGLAVFRGAIAGVEYAEAFQLVKYIDK